MDNIEVKVDKRIELLGVVLRLSKYNERYPQLVKELKNYQYLTDIKDYFSPYKDHEVIEIVNNLIYNYSFAYDAPVMLMLQVDENGFHGHDLYPFADRFKKSPEVLKFLEELKDFEKLSNFDKFFEDHQSLYQIEIESFYKSVDISGILPFMKMLKINLTGK